MKASPWRVAWAVVLLAAVAAVFVVPAINHRLVQGQLTGTLNNVRQIQIAVMQMNLDLTNSGEARSGFPADLGVKSFAEYRARLVKESYLSAADAEKITRGFQLVNVSRDDPPDTAFLLKKGEGRGFVVFTLGGSGGAYKRPADAGAVRLPNRDPAILPDR